MAADKDSGTPRVFLSRHGQTEWSINGRWTGSTDIPLTPAGEAQVSKSARALVGPGMLINPEKLTLILVSPLQRARKTYELIFGSATEENLLGDKVSFTTDLVEWNYGDYEGMKTKGIRELREQRGLNAADWDAFQHGCEGGESPEQVSERLDRIIKQIREIHKPNMHGEKDCDVLLVAHGHILRAFSRRWLGYPIGFPLSMMLEPGGIGILSYQHHNVDEPAFLLGLALP